MQHVEAQMRKIVGMLCVVIVAAGTLFFTRYMWLYDSPEEGEYIVLTRARGLYAYSENNYGLCAVGAGVALRVVRRSLEMDPRVTALEVTQEGMVLTSESAVSPLAGYRACKDGELLAYYNLLEDIAKGAVVMKWRAHGHHSRESSRKVAREYREGEGKRFSVFREVIVQRAMTAEMQLMSVK